MSFHALPILAGIISPVRENFPPMLFMLSVLVLRMSKTKVMNRICFPGYFRFLLTTSTNGIVVALDLHRSGCRDMRSSGAAFGFALF